MPLCKSQFDSRLFQSFEGDLCPAGWVPAVSFKVDVDGWDRFLLLLFVALLIGKGIVDG